MRQWIAAGCIAAAVGFAGAARAADETDATVEATLIDLETKSWVAWKGHDGAFFQSFLSDDHVEVGNGGAIGKKDVVAGVAGPGCTVKDYTLGDIAFTRISADTAMLVYRAAQDTTCGKAVVPSPVWATSVYVNRGGTWLNFLYEHTPANR